MKKSNLKKMVKELIRQSVNSKRIDKMIDGICLSGLLDLENEEETYRLPKQITCAICKQIYSDWQPLSDDRKAKKEIENIWLGINS